MLQDKKALLLDMNGTFMMDADRFGESEFFAETYRKLGGQMPGFDVNNIIRSTYHILLEQYNDVHRCNDFPSVENTVRNLVTPNVSDDEIDRLVLTFAHHELGHIPEEHIRALNFLAQRFVLGAVIDIWSPKALWEAAFNDTGILSLFSFISFSSEHGMVKPSPRPFRLALRKLNVPAKYAVVIGDNPDRDLLGAKGAGIDCILVGGATHPDALCAVSSLSDLCADRFVHSSAPKRHQRSARNEKHAQPETGCR